MWILRVNLWVYNAIPHLNLCATKVSPDPVAKVVECVDAEVCSVVDAVPDRVALPVCGQEYPPGNKDRCNQEHPEEEHEELENTAVLTATAPTTAMTAIGIGIIVPTATAATAATAATCAMALPVRVSDDCVDALADVRMDHAEARVRDRVQVCVDHWADRHVFLGNAATLASCKGHEDGLTCLVFHVKIISTTIKTSQRPTKNSHPHHPT